MTNNQLKDLMKESRVRMWEIAENLQMVPQALSVLFRHPLTDKQQAKVLRAIDEISRRHDREQEEEDE